MLDSDYKKRIIKGAILRLVAVLIVWATFLYAYLEAGSTWVGFLSKFILITMVVSYIILEIISTISEVKNL
jgi:hypothetical protein